jgi:hypothetical protein
MAYQILISIAKVATQIVELNLHIFITLFYMNRIAAGKRNDSFLRLCFF